MFARRYLRLVALCLVASLVAAEFPRAASAEWYRPLTWGEKQSSNGSRQKKNTGLVGGTKRAMSRTADALTPWDNKKKQDNPIAGAGRFFRPDLAHKQQQNETTWYRPATWFRGEPEPKKPLTVTDWMAQDRPEFENR